MKQIGNSSETVDDELNEVENNSGNECKLMNDQFRIVKCFVLLRLHAMKPGKLKVKHFVPVLIYKHVTSYYSLYHIPPFSGTTTMFNKGLTVNINVTQGNVQPIKLIHN